MSTRPFVEISAPEGNNLESLTFANLEIYHFQRDGVYFSYNPALEITGYDYKPEAAMDSFMTTLSELVSHTAANNTFEDLLLELGWTRIDTNRYVGPDQTALLKSRELLRELLEGEADYSRKFQKNLPVATHG